MWGIMFPCRQSIYRFDCFSDVPNLVRRQFKVMAAEAKVEDDYVYTVYILYGPTNVCGLVKHRTGRIENVMGRCEDNYENVFEKPLYSFCFLSSVL